MLQLLLRMWNIKSRGAAIQQKRKTGVVWIESAIWRWCRKANLIVGSTIRLLWRRCKRQVFHSTILGGYLGSVPVSTAQYTGATMFWEWPGQVEENLEEIKKNEKKVWPVRLKRIWHQSFNIAIHIHCFLGVWCIFFVLMVVLQKHWQKLPRITWNHGQCKVLKTSQRNTCQEYLIYVRYRSLDCAVPQGPF